MKRARLEERKQFADEVAASDAERRRRRKDKQRRIQRAQLMNVEQIDMGSSTKASYGAVVSFESPAGRRLTLHRGGEGVTKAIRAACEAALAEDPSYLVVAISTPATIWGDLRGRMFGLTGSTRHLDHTHPEGSLLGRAGFPQLLHPRLRRGGKHGKWL